MKLALTELRRRPGRFSDRHGDPDVDRHLADVPRRAARRIDRIVDRRDPRAGRRRHRLLRHRPGVVRAQPHRAADVRAEVEAVAGVTEVGGIGNVQLGARIPGKGPRDLASVALFGYELAPDGVPDARRPGRRGPTTTIKADGVEEGMIIELGPARSPIEIVGFVERHQLQRPVEPVGVARHVARRARAPTVPTPSSAPTCARA